MRTKVSTEGALRAQRSVERARYARNESYRECATRPASRVTSARRATQGYFCRPVHAMPSEAGRTFLVGGCMMCSNSGPLRPALGCNASCPGVSMESHKFLTRPSRHRRLYRPRPGRLATLISTPGHLKLELITKVKEEVLQLIKDPDDDIVPKGASGPREVHLNDTDYPSTRPIRMALCFGDSLAYYPGCPRAGCPRVETTTCRHITPTMYEMSTTAAPPPNHVCRQLHHLLVPPTPSLCSHAPPPQLREA